jgi:SAM-dependent methyltransferase
MAQIVYSPLETSKAHERRVKEGFFEKYVGGLGLDVGCGYDPICGAFAPERLDREFFEAFSDFSDLSQYIAEAGPNDPDGYGALYGEMPLLWDMCHGNGDAHELAGIPPETFDYVHSSHLLEHLEDPVRFLRRAFEVLKPGGYLLLLVPHRDRYENKRLLPSNWNGDHKSYWLPEEHDPPHTWGLLQVLKLAAGVSTEWNLQYIRVCDEGWTKPPEGQHAGGEYSIEAVVRKL